MTARSVLLATAAVIGMTVLAVPSATIAQPAVIAIDGDDIAGVVTGPSGPEAGVRVIAETTELPTRYNGFVRDNRGSPVPDARVALSPKGGCEAVELKSNVPGLIDSHIHAIRAGLTYQTEVHWIGARTLGAALDRIRAAALLAPKGSWLVVAGGWTGRQFAEGRRPTQTEIAEAAPGVGSFRSCPVLVAHQLSAFDGGDRRNAEQPPGRLASIRLHLELRPALFLCSTLKPVSSSRPAACPWPRVEPRSRLAVAP